jgi:hypothetical protein
MASRNKQLQLAEALLTKEHIHITAEIVDKHLSAAIDKKDRVRIRQLNDLQTLVEQVQGPGEE